MLFITIHVGGKTVMGKYRFQDFHGYTISVSGFYGPNKACVFSEISVCQIIIGFK